MLRAVSPASATEVPLLLAPFGPRVPEAELPPTLLRFPGACGVRDFMDGTLRSYSRADEAVSWFTTRDFGDIHAGAGLFGALVVALPRGTPVVRLSGVDHVFLCLNAPARPEQDVTWVPPRMVREVADWRRFEDLAHVRAACGPSLEEERWAVRQAVNAYFEEISWLTQAGVPYPSTPWYATPLEERLRLLERAGGTPRWSAPPSRTASAP
ncbi:MAG: hypothetical protein RL653_3648 [Pseudomonadota bacterium]|jgi:hypothetical protein